MVLGLVQCCPHQDLAATLDTAATQLQVMQYLYCTCSVLCTVYCVSLCVQVGLQEDKMSAARVRSLVTSLACIRSCGARVSGLALSSTEFAYLRLCVLFKFSEKDEA